LFVLTCMRTRTAPRKKNLSEPVFSVNYFPGHKFHYRSQATPGIRTRRNELLQVESHSVPPDQVPGQSGAGGVLPHAQVTRLRSGTGRPSVAKDGRVGRPRPNRRESAAKSLRSARVSRPRRSADRRSPGDGPTVGVGGRRGRAGQETVPEPAWRASPRSPRSDSPIPCLVPHTGIGASIVRGLVSTRRGSEELGMIARFWPGACCAARLQHAPPIRVVVARARSESSMGPGR